MRFTVDPWDPSYGVANETDGIEETTADVNVDAELPAADWQPLTPEGREPPASILFVDGVRRVEARIWIEDAGGGVHAGVCASFAAGVVRCDGRARVDRVLVGRGLFTPLGATNAVHTRIGAFPVRLATSGTPEGLALALQERMGECELEVAEAACAGGGGDLVMVDGPLRGRQHLRHAVGYVKTHHVAYLPPELHAVVGRLAPGQRSPIFGLGTSWTRLSWYARLPGGHDAPWSGVVRCECAVDLGLAAARPLADTVTAALPHFASAPHKDSRAPQNLYPIAGLERDLRRRLGDPHLVYRALRLASRAERGGAESG